MAAPPPADVAAVVVHYGDPALTWRAVASLAEEPRDLARVRCVLVVENDARRPAAPVPPGLALALAARVEFLRPGENLGFGGGLNAALRRLDPAAAPWLLVINNDAVLEPGCLGALLAALEAAPPAVALAAPLILAPVDRPARDGAAPGEERVWAAGGLLRLGGVRAGNRHHGRLLGEVPPGDLLAPRTQPFVSGCVFLARTETLQQAGGFDPAFFLYYEDVDLCLRLARAAGGAPPALFVPAARARHDVSQGLRFAPLQEYYNWRHRAWIAGRHLAPGARRLAWCWLGAAALAHALRRPWALFGARARARWRGLADARRAAPPPPAPLLAAPPIRNDS